MSITVKRRANGNLIVTIGANDHVEIRAESVEVALEDASNMGSGPPRSPHDVDSVLVSGKQRDVRASDGTAG